MRSSLQVAQGQLSRKCKIEMVGVAVGPGNVYTRSGTDVNFHAGGLAALV
jgi:hypothetical protein